MPYLEISLKILSEFTIWRSDKSARIYLLTPNSQPSCGDAFLALPGLSTVPHNLQYLLFAMSLSGAIVWWQQDNQINYWHTQPSTGVAGQTLQPQVASHGYCSNGKSRNSLCSFLHCLDDVFISLKPVLPISWSNVTGVYYPSSSAIHCHQQQRGNSSFLLSDSRYILSQVTSWISHTETVKIHRHL